MTTLAELEAERERIENQDAESAAAFPAAVAAQLCQFLGMSSAMATRVRGRNDINPRRIVSEWENVIADTELRDKVGVLVSRLNLTNRRKVAR